jgi:DNA polymerase-3 subunit alpha
MPDIDMDFADDDRDKVITYVRKKYGEDHVAGMATFGTMMGRAAVRDVGRVMGLPYSDVDEIAKLVPPPVQGKHIPLKKSIENVPELKAHYEADQNMRKLLDFACKLEGTVRHASQHACAFVICKEPTTTYTPVLPAQRGREGVVTQFSMKPIEDIGLLKMDFLGLSNLTIMRNAVRIVRKVYNVNIEINKLPLDDKKTYELLSRGETTGVFQLESDGMKRYIKELKPTEFNDIIAMCALYRPGPMANIPSYIARKHGKEPVEYLHPKLANSFASTYGIAVYQEQVMQASKDLAGFTGGEADTLRKAMGKKIATLMAEMKTKFITGCKTNSDIGEVLAEKIWKQFEDFAAYGFVKAHAGCYGLIAYQTAYLKAHYPASFFAALLTSNADNLDKMAIEMTEAAKMGIQVLPPDVNESFPEFGVIKANPESEATDQKHGHEYIRFGLAAIKNVGHGVAEKIVEERKNSGPFASLTDFLMRLGPNVLNKRVLESLAMTGALDRFGERNALVNSVEIMIRFIAHRKQDASQMGLFGLETSLVQDIALAEVPPIEKRVSLEWEKTLLGIYLSGHPLKEIEGILPAIATPISRITVGDNGSNQRIGGMVTELRSIMTKNNEAMAFVKLQDMTGAMELVIFPRTWAEARTFVQSDRYIIAEGRVDTRDGSPKLIISRMLELHPEEGVDTIRAALGPIPKANPYFTKKKQEKEAESFTSSTSSEAISKEAGRLLMEIPKQVNRKTLEDIRFILESNPGPVPVYIQALRGEDLTYAKTKSLVTPTKDLLLLLQQAGVKAKVEGVQLTESTEDIEIETYAEDTPAAVMS